MRKLLEIAVKASIEAGFKVLEIYKNDFDFILKSDKSPLTVADTASNDIISSYLENTGIPVLSEEGKEVVFEERSKWEYFWMVDPLDGTKEFIKRNGEFTINVALIHQQKVIGGVVFAPVLKDLYFGSVETASVKIENVLEEDSSSSMDELFSKANSIPVKDDGRAFTVVASKSHMTSETEGFINDLKKTHSEISILSKGSSLKICMVGEGTADVYPRFAPTMEWDTAAGHAVVKFAGGNILNNDTKSELLYNKESLLNPWFIVISPFG
ncbi:MAG: 3'(2'),5'-bisphosphate nucleotidase CysQ [Chlorobi bacterium]|nr:3'(2'),5'-bisphosphate nucleotidase CysQ [Chlorobiota bacterium]